MSVSFTKQKKAQPSVLLPGGETPERFSALLKGIKGKGHNAQVRKFLQARRIKTVFHILQIQEKSGLYTHQFFGTKCLVANIGLATIAVLVADGNNLFFYYFTIGLKGAADHPQLRQAVSVTANAKRRYNNN